jgi:chemotaxis protein CheY-P-specific phosphatase CheC
MGINGKNKAGRLWFDILDNNKTEKTLCAVMENVAQNLTKLIGQPFEFSCLDIKLISLSSLEDFTDDSDTEAVGIYLLLMDEELPGEAMLVLAPDEAMIVVDWLLEESPGTTTYLGDLENSALSELGNQALSSFLNTIADLTCTPLRPSPPTVVVDTMAIISKAVALSAATVTNEFLLIKTNLINYESSLKIQIWIVPDFIITSVPVSVTTNEWKWNALEEGL